MQTFTFTRELFFKQSNNGRAEKFSPNFGQEGDRSLMSNPLNLLIHEAGN